MQVLFELARDLMVRGGVVMWPLLALSLLSVTLIFERCWFFMFSNHPGRMARVRYMARCLREGNHNEAQAIAKTDGGIYGKVVQRILHEKPTQASAIEVVEFYRPKLERFMPTLSTIITVAPMLGILGTVLGIISSFQLLSDPGAVSDPRSVSLGIAEALFTTAAGLVVAILTLFPYNALRVQVERSLSAIETLAWAAVADEKSEKSQDSEG